MKNVPIKIIDNQFNFLGEVDDYAAFIATRSFSGIGGFELHLSADNKYASVLELDNIIFTTPKKAYIILRKELTTDGNTLKLRGYQLKSYLNQYITYPPTGQAYHRINSNIETIMKTYVEHNLVLQGIADIVVAPNQNRGGDLIYQTRYKPLDEELGKIGLVGGMGWDLTLDFANKKFVFDVIESVDRTANQDINSRAIFSMEFDNLGTQTLVKDKLNYKNVAIVAGQGSGVDRAITIIGNATGLDRRELFVDARDIENAEDLPSRGEQKLSEFQEVFTFDSQILTNSNLIYEEDYNLGDLVTVQSKKWNVTLDTRINNITEILESDGLRLEATFGNNIPTIMDVIKKATDTPITESGGGGEIPSASSVPVTSENFESTNVAGALDELFTSVSNGKSLIATAITDKGVPTSSSDSFQVMVNNIEQISGGISEIVPGDTILYLDDKEETLDNTKTQTLITLKKYKILLSGTMRVTFNLKSGSLNREALGQIYVNGVAIGIQRKSTTDTRYTKFTEDITFATNDILELKVVKGQSSSTSISSSYFAFGIASNLENSVEKMVVI